MSGRFGVTSGLFGIFRQLILAAEFRQLNRNLGRNATRLFQVSHGERHKIPIVGEPPKNLAAISRMCLELEATALHRIIV